LTCPWTRTGAPFASATTTSAIPFFDKVAATIQPNPQVQRVRIDGHTSVDPLSATRKVGAAGNRKLSQ
jgi:flagellar motor protein MotB